MTNAAAMPSTCGSGFTMLSEYCVAMAAVSLARGCSGKKRRASSHARPRPHVGKSRSSRVRQTKFNEKELRRTKPVATCPVSLARLKQNSTHRWVNCALHKSFGALRHPTIGTD
jgi:hypothetical protein